MSVERIPAVDVARAFQVSATVSRPSPIAAEEKILQILDAQPKSHNRIHNNHLGGPRFGSQLDFSV